MLPRRITVLSNSVESRMDNIRNAIEHIEGRIRAGQLIESDTIALTVKSDSIEFGGEEFYFTELAEWIRQLDALTGHLASSLP